jgi:hypothetical protein
VSATQRGELFGSAEPLWRYGGVEILRLVGVGVRPKYLQGSERVRSGRKSILEENAAEFGWRTRRYCLVVRSKKDKTIQVFVDEVEEANLNHEHYCASKSYFKNSTASPVDAVRAVAQSSSVLIFMPVVLSIRNPYATKSACLTKLMLHILSSQLATCSDYATLWRSIFLIHILHRFVAIVLNFFRGRFASAQERT